MEYKINHIANKKKLTNRKMNPQYITIHSTGNLNSTAQNERDNLNRPGNIESTGFHIAIDEDMAIECIPLDMVAYHAGDGRDGKGNTESIGIEICESGDRQKTINNTVKLVAKMLHDRGWNTTRLCRHYDWNKKICPGIMAKNDWQGWKDFLKEVDKELKSYNAEIKMEEWEREQGIQAIEQLAQKGILNNPQMWTQKLNGGHIPDWAIWSLLNRITKLSKL